MAWSLARLQMCIKIVEEFCKEFDVIISIKKTKWMLIGKQDKADKKAVLTINGEIIERVEKFKLLGHWIESNMSDKEHIAVRVDKRGFI